jgi:GNAT superfamily N-acetyltransferase
MIRACGDDDFESVYEIINDGARVYRGVIPDDRLRDPYMSRDELRHELDDGVVFSGFEEGGKLLGVMGVQYVQDVTLIRHAYVRTTAQGRGVGGMLLEHLRPLARGPILIGTWAASYWAIGFYERHGFRVVTPAEKEVLLRRYWKVPERQIETSVVLADANWTST